MDIAAVANGYDLYDKAVVFDAGDDANSADTIAPEAAQTSRQGARRRSGDRHEPEPACREIFSTRSRSTLPRPSEVLESLLIEFDPPYDARPRSIAGHRQTAGP